MSLLLLTVLLSASCTRHSQARSARKLRVCSDPNNLPYYRSTYVFVTRKDSGLKLASLNDAALRRVKIGVQVIGDDGANAPPAHALANRGIVQNVRGYTVYGDYAEDSPPARIIDAVENRDVDVAIVWGPLAGYFVKQRNATLELTPLSPPIDSPSLPFVYDISLGVRRGEKAFKSELEAALKRRRAEVERILDDYGIPRIGPRVGPRVSQ